MVDGRMCVCCLSLLDDSVVSVMICTGGSSVVKGVTKKQSEENSDSRFTQRFCHVGCCREWHQKLQATCLGRRTMMNITGMDCGILHLAKQRMAVFFRLGLLAGLSRKLSVGLAGRSERKASMR